MLNSKSRNLVVLNLKLNKVQELLRNPFQPKIVHKAKKKKNQPILKAAVKRRLNVLKVIKLIHCTMEIKNRRWQTHLGSLRL